MNSREHAELVKTKNRGFGQQAVVNTDARLLVGNVHQRHIRRAGFCVVKNRMTRAERAASAVLTGQTNRFPFQEKGSESKQLRVMPFVRSPVLENLATMFEYDALDLRLNIELFGHMSQRIDNLLQRFFADRG